MKVTYEGNHQTLQFAAEELARYLGMMTGRQPSIEAANSAADGIHIGLTPASSQSLNLKFDDEISIDVKTEPAAYRE